MNQDTKKETDKTSEERTEEPTSPVPPPTVKKPAETQEEQPAKLPAQPQPPRQETPPPFKPEEEIKKAVSLPIKIWQTLSDLPGIKTVRTTITQKVFQPIVGRLAKTALGKTIKTGINLVKQTFKKAIGSVISKVSGVIAKRITIEGIKKAFQVLIQAIPGIGTAIAILTEVVAPAIEYVLKKIYEKVIFPILNKIQSLTGDWKSSLALIGLGGILIVYGGTMGLITGTIIGGLGVLGLATGGAVGAAIGTLSGGIIATYTMLFPSIMIPALILITGIIVGIMVITFSIVMTTTGAFILPFEPGGFIFADFDVIKTVSRKKIPNTELTDDGPCVRYTVTVNSSKEIEISSIVDRRIIEVCDPSNTQNPQIEEPVIDIPTPDNPVTHYFWPDTSKGDNPEDYQLCFNKKFENCRVCNTVTVTADIIDGPSGVRKSDTQCVEVGTPPENCPSGWPTEHGYITQGPKTPQDTDDWCTSHFGQEAIDIGGVGIGTPVYATHQGTASYGSTPKGGKFVAITSKCTGKTFTSYYYHLNSINPDIQTDPDVGKGDPIGTTGMTGSNVKGAHLHYEFDALEMDSEYIPIEDDILENCCTPCGSCHDRPCVDANKDAISW